MILRDLGGLTAKCGRWEKALLQTISWEIGLAALLSEVIKKAADKLVVHFHTGLLRQFAKPLP